MEKVSDTLTEPKNKQPIDILADLFKESAGESSRDLEKLSELAYRKHPSPGIMDQSENRGGIIRGNERETKLKRELSYSISKRKVFEDGAPKVKVKIVVPKTIEHQVSMSRIVDHAIESFLEELKSAVEE